MAGWPHRVLLPLLNRLIGSESWAQERLRVHAGAGIVIVAGPLSLPLQIDGQGFFRAPAAAALAADVILTLPSDAPLRLLVDRESVFAALRLEGRAEIAESLGFVFRNLRWDSEGDLAQLIGDIPARRLSLFGRRLAHGCVAGLRRMADNVTDYAREDSAPVVSQHALRLLTADLERLQFDLKRLEQRISAL